MNGFFHSFRGIKGDLFVRWGSLHCTRATVFRDGATECKHENLPRLLFSKEG
jgi:hypothetical protein